MSAEDIPEELGGFLGFLLDQEEAQEPACALCGRPIRPGEPRRVRQDGRAEHLKCPPQQGE